MSNKRAAARRNKRLNRVPHHVVVQRQRNKFMAQKRAKRLEELAANPEAVAS